MDKKDLLRWGGRSAHIAVALLVVSIAAYWITGGLEFRAWVPLFSTFAGFLLVAALATYEYLSVYQYSLARIGAAFGGLSILVFFLEAVVWGADRMILRGGAPTANGLSPMLALFNSLHMLVLWLISAWMALWGVGMIRIGGRAKMAGTFMVLVAGFHLFDYALARTGGTGLLVEVWHLGSQAFLLSAFTTIGFILLEASRSEMAAT